MAPDKPDTQVDSTAVRVAMHVEIDSPPHVFEDEVSLKLAAPDEGWRSRPDMDSVPTPLFRVSIVAHARFIEDLVLEQARQAQARFDPPHRSTNRTSAILLPSHRPERPSQSAQPAEVGHTEVVRAGAFGAEVISIAPSKLGEGG